MSSQVLVDGADNARSLRPAVAVLIGVSSVLLFATYIKNRIEFVGKVTAENVAHTPVRALRESAFQGYNFAGQDMEGYASRFSNMHLDTPCRTDWAGTWSASPARSFFTGNLTVAQVGCNVTESWWEFVTDWQCRGLWVTGWIQLRSNYTARGQEIIPISKDKCSGHEGWRPSNMVLTADGKKANGSNEVWTRERPALPKPPLPSCLPEGECVIGFDDGFKPPCCDGLVLQQDYSNTCHHPVGKYGYPEGGNSCQKKACLNMGKDCFNDRAGCCPGLSCQDMGISGFMCA